MLSVAAERLENYSLIAEVAKPERHYDVTLNFCNVTTNYGHEGWKDNVQVTVWLPLEGWNGRLSGIGGSGLSSLWTYNRFTPAVTRGYAAVGTDAGHVRNPLDATSWVLDTAGNVNFFFLQNFLPSPKVRQRLLRRMSSRTSTARGHGPPTGTVARQVAARALRWLSNIPPLTMGFLPEHQLSTGRRSFQPCITRSLSWTT